MRLYAVLVFECVERAGILMRIFTCAIMCDAARDMFDQVLVGRVKTVPDIFIDTQRHTRARFVKAGGVIIRGFTVKTESQIIPRADPFRRVNSARL